MPYSGFTGVAMGSGYDRDACFRSDLADAPERLLTCPERGFKRGNRLLRDGEKEAAGGLRVEQDVAHLFGDVRRDLHLAVKIAPVPGAAAGRNPSVRIIERAPKQRQSPGRETESC